MKEITSSFFTEQPLYKIKIMRSSVLQELLDETPKDLRLMLKMHAQISMRVQELMDEAGISQKELAESMRKKPSELNKWLKSGHNMTLRSMAKLQIALDKVVIQVPSERSFDWSDGVTFSRKTKFIVSKNKEFQEQETSYTFVATEEAPSVVKRLLPTG